MSKYLSLKGCEFLVIETFLNMFKYYKSLGFNIGVPNYNVSKKCIKINGSKVTVEKLQVHALINQTDYIKKKLNINDNSINFDNKDILNLLYEEDQNLDLISQVRWDKINDNSLIKCFLSLRSISKSILVSNLEETFEAVDFFSNNPNLFTDHNKKFLKDFAKYSQYIDA